MAAITKRFEAANLPILALAFPGRSEATLGELVYRIHHSPNSLGLTKGLTATALQTLHIAAHIDAIQSGIIPALEMGVTVVLDRFWWSTWVYGTLDGIEIAVLRNLIELEKSVWGDYVPSLAILLERLEPLREDAKEGWKSRQTAYADLAKEESMYYPVCMVNNDRLFDETVDHVWELIWQNKSE
jgi:thymidylate kinase